jgi:hypothetical protein
MASKNPDVRAIELEASRRSKMDGRSSRAERLALRNELRAEQGMSAEKRKRGGFAGVWDRNKKVIKPVVSGALGLIPGIGIPLAAGAGALMSGLDRPGKGGVGFDVGRGLQGAAEGAAAGYAGKGAKSLFTGTGARSVAARDKLGKLAWEAGSVPGRAMSWVAKNPIPTGQAIMGYRKSQMEAADQRIANQNQRVAMDEYNRRLAERQRMADALRPLFLRLQERVGERGLL